MKVFIIMWIFAALVVCSSLVYAKSALVDQKCGSCHTTRIVYNKKADKQTWDAIVERMKKHGMKITDEEEKQIMEYLYTLK